MDHTMTILMAKESEGHCGGWSLGSKCAAVKVWCAKKTRFSSDGSRPKRA